MVSSLLDERSRSSRNTQFRYSKQVSRSNWLFSLCNEEGIWQELIQNKYLKNKKLSQVLKQPGNSHIWMSLMGVNEQFLSLENLSW